MSDTIARGRRVHSGNAQTDGTWLRDYVTTAARRESTTVLLFLEQIATEAAPANRLKSIMYGSDPSPAAVNIFVTHCGITAEEFRAGWKKERDWRQWLHSAPRDENGRVARLVGLQAQEGVQTVPPRSPSLAQGALALGQAALPATANNSNGYHSFTSVAESDHQASAAMWRLAKRLGLISANDIQEVEKIVMDVRA